jgi:LysM repeat protein
MPRVLNYIFYVIFAFVALVGCAPSGVEVVSETNEKQYQLGLDYKNQGRMEEALGAFERVIDARRDAPESHFEAGYIYLHTLKDPINAIYHFNCYLRLQPQSPQASQVRQLIETAQKEFARQLPAQPYEGELDRIDLMDLVKTLKQENDSLKQDLVAATARVQQLENVLGQARRATLGQTSSQSLDSQTGRSSSTTVSSTSTLGQTSTPSVAPSPSNAPRTYQVQSGDTLSAISRRFYGTPSRWIDIYQANRDRLSSESALRVGQDIRIP